MHVSFSGTSLIQPLIVARKMWSDKWLPSKTVSLQSRHPRRVTKRVNLVFGERSPSPLPWVGRKISSGTAFRANQKTGGNLPKTPQDKRSLRLVGTQRRTPPAFSHSWRCSRQHHQVCAQGPGSDRHQRVLQVTIFPAQKAAVSPGRVELRSKLLENGCWLFLTEDWKATFPGLFMSRRRCATAVLSPAPPWKRHPGQPP